jgi:hypothetical protein
MSSRGRLWTQTLLIASVPTVIFTGCREELGPEHFATTSVSGVVVEGGRPIARGWIEFIPVEATVGNIRSARIESDGTFQADRVAIGENAIRLVSAPIELRGGAQLFGQFSTPLRRRIPQEPSGPLKIDLLEEAVRYQVKRSRTAESRSRNHAARTDP